MTATAPSATPEQLNQRMIDAIRDAHPVGTRNPRVLAAIRTVPRHAFVPGADLADAYDPDLAVITKRDAAGTALSCASVPKLVAAMLDQLDVHDGSRVFEAGAGTGWNAALLANLAGPGGHVSTVDIDPQIAKQANSNLDRAGFHGVHVTTGDAALGDTAHAPYDRAIVTIGSLDIPPAWVDQLTPGGRLVVPLRWRGQTQSIAFVRGADGVLRSDSVFLCGFVPMIGQGWERSCAIDPGGLVHLYWDADQDINPAALAGVLESGKQRIDSDVLIGPYESFDGIWVRASATDPAVCRIAAEPAAVQSGLCTPAIRTRTLALAEGNSLAYLVFERLSDEQSRSRLGAVGHGPRGADLAQRLCWHIEAWGADRGAAPTITVYPEGVSTAVPEDNVIRREHCQLVVSY